MAVDKYFDELETMSLTEREHYQSEKLSQFVKYAYKHSPAAKTLFGKSGVLPEQIHIIKDLEKLPVTRKTDLIEMQKVYPPYGGLLMIPAEDVERVFISPGPIYEPHQKASIKWFAKSFYAAGFRKGDVVVNTFTYHMSPAGVLFHEAISHCGATVVVMGTGNTDILVKTMHALQVTGFVGTPTFLATVIKRAEELGYNFKLDFSLKRAWFTGEMLPTSLRNTFEDNYQVSTAQAYAVTEPGGAIAYECSEKSGMHLMDEYVVEIVDPQTGKQLPYGSIGEIVVTPVHNRTWGLMRFGTGDMSSIVTGKCPCGRTAYKLAGIAGRTTDAVKVRGMFVVAKQVEQIIAKYDSIAKFQLLVTRKENRDDITLKIELKNDTVDKDVISGKLSQDFQDVCRLKIDSILITRWGTIAEQSPKIVDERRWD